MSKTAVLAGLCVLMLSGCAPAPIVIVVTPVVVTATSPPVPPTRVQTPTPRNTATPRVAPMMAVTPYDGCMTGSDLAEWREWDAEFWNHYEVAFQVGGSYTGGNYEEAQATIAATSAFADWVGDHPPSVSNMHQYEVMLRLARTWRDWVYTLWAANTAGDYDTYKENADKFDILYPRFNELYDIVIQQEEIMDQCPPALGGSNPGT